MLFSVRSGWALASGIGRRPSTRATVVVLAGALVASAGEARAEWQSTRWGMSLADAMAAVPGARPLADGTEAKTATYGIARARFEWSSGPFQFFGTLAFDPASNGLSAVLLDAVKGSDCLGILRELTIRYGAPRSTAPNYGQSHQWLTDKTLIQLHHTWPRGGAQTCIVSYRSRVTPSNRGL